MSTHPSTRWRTLLSAIPLEGNLSVTSGTSSSSSSMTAGSNDSEETGNNGGRDTLRKLSSFVCPLVPFLCRDWELADFFSMSGPIAYAARFLTMKTFCKNVSRYSQDVIRTFSIIFLSTVPGFPLLTGFPVRVLSFFPSSNVAGRLQMRQSFLIL